jgi:23S rRNA pseudouridine1911/1915/1917 synthase
MYNARRASMQHATQRAANNRPEPQRTNYARERLTEFRIDKEDTLMAYLIVKMGSMSRNSIKNLLTKRRISVNGQIESKYDFPLHPGDIVKLDSTNTKYRFSHPKISIIYEDSYLLAINKDVGILSVSTPRHEESTAYKVMLNYVKKQNMQNNLFVVHRIDRETSGVLLFAKDPETQMLLKEHWHDESHQRFYYALVEGVMEKNEDTIISWLTENQKSLKVHSSFSDDGGAKAITSYKMIGNKDGLSLLKVNIKTGRKNQIRVQLSAIGHPIVGDRKYGAHSSPIGRLGLHAAMLGIIHPQTGEHIQFEAPIPKCMHLK